MANLRRSLLIHFCSSSGSTVMKFGVSILLARMLSPSEIGVFSMTVVLVNIAHIFREFGVGTYLQREKELTPEKLRSALGVSLTSSWLIALVLFLLSSPVAGYFDEPQMVPVMRVLALGFMFIPFGAITAALLTREYAAGKQMLVNAAGTTSYCASCLILAWLDFGTMALAWANLVNIVVCGLVYIPLRPKGLPWLPSFRKWGSVVRFGAGSLISNCAMAIDNAIPDVLLGKIGSSHLVGLLSRANSTVTIFTHIAGSTVNYGAVAYLAKTHHQGEALKPTLLRTSALLTGIGWPALAFTAVLGDDIVLALYGPTWLASVPAILPLTMAAALTMLFHYTPMALTAIGRPYLGAAPISVSIIARIGVGIALFDGTLAAFAWAIFVATLCTAPITAYLQQHYLGVSVGDNLRNMLPSVAVTLMCATAALVINRFLVPQSLPPMARLLIMAAPLAAVWYGSLRLTGHQMLPEVHRMRDGAMARFRKPA